MAAKNKKNIVFSGFSTKTIKNLRENQKKTIKNQKKL
jgi:hypothetical protein